MVKTIVILGILCMVAAIVGGRLKAVNIDFPPLKDIKRQIILFALGLLLLIIGILLPFFYEKITHTKEVKFQALIDKQPISNLLVTVVNVNTSYTSNRDGWVNLLVDNISKVDSLNLSFSSKDFNNEYDTTIQIENFPAKLYLRSADFKRKLHDFSKYNISFSVFFRGKPIEGVNVTIPEVGASNLSNRDGLVNLVFDYSPDIEFLHFYFNKVDSNIDFDTLISVKTNFNYIFLRPKIINREGRNLLNILNVDVQSKRKLINSLKTYCRTLNTINFIIDKTKITKLNDDKYRYDYNGNVKVLVNGEICYVINDPIPATISTGLTKDQLDQYLESEKNKIVDSKINIVISNIKPCLN